MIHDSAGNLLTAQAEALVNTVNTEGVMGRGIAFQFKRAYPEMFKAYVKACKADQVRLGEMWVWSTASLEGPRLVINFPTKGHWRSRSRITDIANGLVDLVRVIEEYGISSIAVPPLGCGNGGLNWAQVRPIIESALGPLTDVNIHLYPPDGAPAADAMPTRTERPRMTRGKAALVYILHKYSQRSMEVSLIEAQKLMYFLQESGEPLRLQYVKGRYGPNAENLGHVLKNVEGHFISGFGDGSRRVLDTEPLTLLPDAVKEASAVVSGLTDLRDRIDAVLRLADGFESAYDLELLATVHWVATREDRAAIDDSTLACRLIRAWSPRKSGLFSQAHVDVAWKQLHVEGWFDTSSADDTRLDIG